MIVQGVPQHGCKLRELRQGTTRQRAGDGHASVHMCLCAQLSIRTQLRVHESPSAPLHTAQGVSMSTQGGEWREDEEDGEEKQKSSEREGPRYSVT